MRIPDQMLSCKRVAGFTLLELMITLTVAAILAAVAIPNMGMFIRNNRLSSVANDLLRSFQLARSEAIKRQGSVAICASNNPDALNATCSYGELTGWIVFEDSNSNWQRETTEAIIDAHSTESEVIIKNDNDGITLYAQTGFAQPPGTKTPTRNVVICDSRGNFLYGDTSVARAVFVTETGRVRISKSESDITTAITLAGSCS